MRDREEIEDIYNISLSSELLLDIRDLLLEILGKKKWKKN